MTAVTAFLRRVFRPCRHANLRGVANYYDREFHCYVHLHQCQDCGDPIITTER